MIQVDSAGTTRTSAENPDLDAVADVKLAVGEASACPISRATLGARLEGRAGRE